VSVHLYIYKGTVILVDGTPVCKENQKSKHVSRSEPEIKDGSRAKKWRAEEARVRGIRLQ